MSELSDLLDRLAAGQVTIGAVVADFVTRKWEPGLGSASTYEAAEKRAQQDVAPMVKGSWEEVSAAYAAGKLTATQYEVLFRTRNGRARP